MDADVGVDNELLAGQAHAIVGDLALGEGLLRNGQVHHDLGLGFGQITQIEPLHLEVQQPLVDEALFAFGRGNGDVLAALDHLGAVTGTDNAGDAKLAGDDGGVAGTAAAVGDNGGGDLHNRLPVGVGHVGDQHLAFLEAVDISHIGDDIGLALADLGAHGQAFHQHLAPFLELVGFHGALGGLGMDGFGPGLDDEQVAGADLFAVAILGPLDIHGLAVMLLDDAGPLGELQDLIVVDYVCMPLIVGGGDVLHRLVVASLVVVDHLHLFAAHPLADDGPLAFLEGGLEDVIFVRVDSALHDVLAQAPGAGYEDGILKAALGVDGEHDTGGGGIAAHHLLDGDGEVDVELSETLVVTVGNGPVGEEAGKALLAVFDQGVNPADIQVGFLLAGKGGIGQVLGSGRRTDRHVNVLAVLGLHLLVGLDDGLAQVVRELGVADDVAGLFAALLQVSEIVGVEAGQRLFDGLFDTGGLEQVAIGIGGDGKAMGYRNSLGGEITVHLAQGGVFAANQGHVVDADIVEP